MGRNRLPDEVKKLTGTLQNCRVNTSAPKPDKGFPVAPGYLTPEELKAWNQSCQLCDSMGVLTLPDAFAVEELAVCKAQLLVLREDLRVNGWTYVTDAGLVKVRPQVRMEADKSRHFLMLLGKFGLTPESRSKVNAKTGEAENPFDSI